MRCGNAHSAHTAPCCRIALPVQIQIIAGIVTEAAYALSENTLRPSDSDKLSAGQIAGYVVLGIVVACIGLAAM